MKNLRRAFPISIVLLLAMVVAACGSTGAGGSTPTPAATTPAPAATTPATSASTVMTATATVQGKSVTILTNAQGMTLYYFKPDTATTSACTGGCAQNWPPLLATGSGSPTSATTLPGMLTAVTSGNGNQVEYNGHFLYTFSGDSASGQTNGEGVGGKWFVCTPDLAAASSNSNAIIQTAAATVQGKSVTILTDTKGDTLYYFTPDTATKSACTGGCAGAWPPLLMTGSGTPSVSTTLSGTLTAVSSGNGNQVEYNGHLLYTYSGDTTPGQTKGEGLFGKWFVATTDLK
jgi:predicted lipoprotein with Yx(FWY)xxD motif